MGSGFFPPPHPFSVVVVVVLNCNEVLDYKNVTV